MRATQGAASALFCGGYAILVAVARPYKPSDGFAFSLRGHRASVSSNALELFCAAAAAGAAGIGVAIVELPAYLEIVGIVFLSLVGAPVVAIFLMQFSGCRGGGGSSGGGAAKARVAKYGKYKSYDAALEASVVHFKQLRLEVSIVSAEYDRAPTAALAARRDAVAASLHPPHVPGHRVCGGGGGGGLCACGGGAPRGVPEGAPDRNDVAIAPARDRRGARG